MTSTGAVQRFRAAWDGMTPVLRQSVTLRCQGYTNKEVGARLGRSGDTVKNNVWRAMQRLSGALLAEPGVSPVLGMDMICYRLGYERALADVERLAGSKR